MRHILRMPFLLILIPITEIFVLIEVGGLIGALPTVALVLVTAGVGIHLIRRQGTATFQRVQGQLQSGVLPAVELVEGLILLVAGAFLLTPGFVTDTLGFLALTPPLRRAFAVKIIQSGRFQAAGHTSAGNPPPSGPSTIDGEYRRLDDER